MFLTAELSLQLLEQCLTILGQWFLSPKHTLESLEKLCLIGQGWVLYFTNS